LTLGKASDESELMLAKRVEKFLNGDINE